MAYKVMHGASGPYDMANVPAQRGGQWAVDARNRFDSAFQRMQAQRAQSVAAGTDPYKLADGTQRNPDGSPTYGLSGVTRDTRPMPGIEGVQGGGGTLDPASMQQAMQQYYANAPMAQPQTMPGTTTGMPAIGGPQTMPGAGGPDPFAAFRTEQLDPNRAFIGGAGISELLNPYLQQVRDQTMMDTERQRRLAQATTDDAALRAKAFGGDRHGVANALTNDAFARAAAQQYAGLNAQGFNTAAQLAGQNANNYMQGRAQDIGQNMGFMGGALQQRQQDIGYGLGTAANQLNAYQTAGSLLNQSGLMDWLSVNQGANATGSLPSNQASTTQDGGSNWNNIIGGLFTGLGLLRG